MNIKNFSEAMGEVSDKYLTEAINYKKRYKKYGWIKWGAITACFVAASITIFIFSDNYLNRINPAPPDNSNNFDNPNSSDNPNNPDSVIADNLVSDTPDTLDTPPVTEASSEIHINMNDISINDIAEFVDAAKMWYDPELYDYVVWDNNSILAYYGKDLTPAYIPAGLLANANNGTANGIIEKDGIIIEDAVWLSYYHDYYDDNSPKLTDYAAAVKGFSIEVSKIGIVNDCIYILPENEVKVSHIGGIPVTFGYRSMPYGPFDPQTHEPSGYYDMYVVNFKEDGIEYQIVAAQMEIEELVKVVTSIIYDEREIVIDK